MPSSKSRKISSPRRKIIVHIATSADGYIARTDDDLEWLIDRPAPKGFYGLPAFERTIDTKVLGRQDVRWSLKMGAPFGGKTQDIVFTHRPPLGSQPPRAFEFVTEARRPISSDAAQCRGRNIWLMGGGGLIASFLDAGAIDGSSSASCRCFIGEEFR